MYLNASQLQKYLEINQFTDHGFMASKTPVASTELPQKLGEGAKQ